MKYVPIILITLLIVSCSAAPRELTESELSQLDDIQEFVAEFNTPGSYYSDGQVTMEQEITMKGNGRDQEVTISYKIWMTGSIVIDDDGAMSSELKLNQIITSTDRSIDDIQMAIDMVTTPDVVYIRVHDVRPKRVASRFTEGWINSRDNPNDTMLSFINTDQMLSMFGDSGWYNIPAVAVTSIVLIEPEGINEEPTVEVESNGIKMQSFDQIVPTEVDTQKFLGQVDPEKTIEPALDIYQIVYDVKKMYETPQVAENFGMFNFDQLGVDMDAASYSRMILDGASMQVDISVDPSNQNFYKSETVMFLPLDATRIFRETNSSLPAGSTVHMDLNATMSVRLERMGQDYVITIPTNDE